jgi:hypothetical protein
MSRWFLPDEVVDEATSKVPEDDLNGLGDDLMAQLDFVASESDEEEILLVQPPRPFAPGARPQ